VSKSSEVLKNEAACSSEAIVFTHKSTRGHTPEDHNLNAHIHENLRPHFMKLYLKNLNAFFAQSTVDEYIMRRLYLPVCPLSAAYFSATVP
jgi:hypothetical protein